jgi:sterol desaturase/sphingolipid hydroxylase (fatty acid hydroxylase superfamily)
MNPFALSFAFMLALILAEAFWLQRQRGQAIDWVDTIFNLNAGHLLMWVLRGVEVALFGWVLQHASLHWLDAWPLAAVALFGWVAWDFCFYWMHRLHHRIPLLWAVHRVHHQGEHFNLSLGVRNSWYSSLTSFLFVAVLAVIGLPLEVFVLVSSLHYAVQFYNHNALVQRSGWLERWFITPSHHRVHHGVHPRYLNRNFGGTLLLWDRLFGSFQPELPELPLRYGVPGEPAASANPLWANHPGLQRWWQARWPLPVAAARWPAGVIGSGGVLLFGLVIHFVNLQPRLQGAEWAVLLAGIVAGTLALGGLSDGRRWGQTLWLLLCLPGTAAYAATLGWRNPYGALCLLALAGHGAWMLWRTRQRPCAEGLHA